MKKKIVYSILFVFLLLLAFSLWMSPSMGGFLPGGKSTHDKTVEQIEFDKDLTGRFDIKYAGFKDRPDAVKLRETFKLDSIVGDAANDFERILRIQSWVQSRWVHDGDNVPEKNDAFYILTEAQKGRRFRCVEYSTVAAECLKSLGFKVRSLGLMTKDVNEVNYGAGHVVNEVFLEDLQKWVFIDPQYDIIVTKNGVPLNAVELQHAIAHHQEVELINPNQVISREKYIAWVGPYLYYFTIGLNKGNIGIWDRIIGNKKQLTLVPKGAQPPKYFQRLFRINTAYFTNSEADFYQYESTTAVHAQK